MPLFDNYLVTTGCSAFVSSIKATFDIRESDLEVVSAFWKVHSWHP